MNYLKCFFSLFFILAVINGCQSGVNNSSDEISADAIIKSINKGKPIVVVNKTIKGKLDFTKVSDKTIETEGNFRVWINSPITFINCKFTDTVSAYGFTMQGKHKINVFVSFNRNVTFTKCEFHKPVYFNESDIIGLANFSGSTFYYDAVFEGGYFRFKNTYFTNALFKGKAKFQRTLFLGDVSFFQSQFDGKVYFQYSTVYKNAQFSNTKYEVFASFDKMSVNGELLFDQSEFKGDCYFNNSSFDGRTDFHKVIFNKKVSFKNAKIKERLNFSKAQINDTIIFENSVLYSLPDTTETITTKKIKFPNSSIINRTATND